MYMIEDREQETEQETYGKAESNGWCDHEIHELTTEDQCSATLGTLNDLDSAPGSICADTHMSRRSSPGTCC